MSTNILLTGGRAPVTLDLARLLSAAGDKIFVADSLKHHLCSYSRAVVKNFLVPPPRLNPTGYISALVEIVKTAGKGSCIYFESVNHPQLLHWIKTFVEAEEFTGQIAFDFIEADGILYPLECNPRAISAIQLFQKSDRLYQAFFNTTNIIIQPKVKQRAMIGMAMVVYGLGSAIISKRLGEWLKIFTNTKDVIFRLSDPLPFFHLWIVLLQFILRSWQTNLTLQQVSTQDIEWDGEDLE